MRTARRRIVMLGTSLKTMGGVSSVVRTYEAAGLLDRWPITYVPTHMDGHAYRKILLALRAFLRTSGWMLFRRDLLLHVHVASRASFWRKSLFLLIAFLTRTPVIFHLHGAEFMRFYHDECGPIRQAMIRFILHRCSRIVVLSETWRRGVETITDNAAIEVIMNPVLPPEGGSRASWQQREVLLFLGRLGQRKGIYVLLDALSHVKRRHPGVMLMCGGDGEMDLVSQRAEELGLKSNVQVLGWVGDAERSRLFDHAWIYVLPSFAEGLPMSVLEAMAAGLPVVSTPVGGIPDVITHGKEGLLVPAGDVTRLSDAICMLLERPDLRAEMGRNGFARCERSFSARAVMPKLEAIYRSFGVKPRSRGDSRVPHRVGAT